MQRQKTGKLNLNNKNIKKINSKEMLWFYQSTPELKMCSYNAAVPRKQNRKHKPNVSGTYAH